MSHGGDGNPLSLGGENADSVPTPGGGRAAALARPYTAQIRRHLGIKNEKV